MKSTRITYLLYINTYEKILRNFEGPSFQSNL